MPDLDLSEESILRIATENSSSGYTVPGVQKKLSLHLDKGKEPRLTLINYPTGFILKPQTAEYQALPEAEYLVMQMAARTGIRTVPFALIKMKNNDERYAYMTRRIDRILQDRKNTSTQMLAMEDFCQLDGRLTEDKYRGSYERCARLIRIYSTSPGLDLSELFLRVAFSYAIGNSDMHLKNFSLIETSPGSQEYELSEAYDMLPTNIILPEDTEQMALTLNGKKSNLRRKDFLSFANASGIPEKPAERLMERITSMQSTYVEMCRNSYMPEKMKVSMERLILERSFR
jgi:serine/threonine-protein kinase HipA